MSPSLTDIVAPEQQLQQASTYVAKAQLGGSQWLVFAVTTGIVSLCAVATVVFHADLPAASIQAGLIALGVMLVLGAESLRRFDAGMPWGPGRVDPADVVTVRLIGAFMVVVALAAVVMVGTGLADQLMGLADA